MADWPEPLSDNLNPPRTPLPPSPSNHTRHHHRFRPAPTSSPAAGRGRFSQAIICTDGQARSGPCFENDMLLIRAAVASQGLALVRDIYAHDELSAGRIVPALEHSIPTVDAYYFVARPEAMKLAKVSAFRRWILEEWERS
ncbi:LysR substrate-binding domain-containing protein [Mesorhizobium sp. DCY119]|uniref:LysR substrate-binding domain-containing protein n=1 Tax=Mesorhizobium sp. DCY119 TaxID=2108445 RepID=UPI0032AFC909